MIDRQSADTPERPVEHDDIAKARRIL